MYIYFTLLYLLTYLLTAKICRCLWTLHNISFNGSCIIFATGRLLPYWSVLFWLDFHCASAYHQGTQNRQNPGRLWPLNFIRARSHATWPRCTEVRRFFTGVFLNEAMKTTTLSKSLMTSCRTSLTRPDGAWGGRAGRRRWASVGAAWPGHR